MNLRTRLSAAVVVTSLAGPAGCVDTTPVDYVAPDGGQADGGDAGTLPDAAGLIDACRQCATTGACKAQYDTCAQDPKCKQLEVCAIDTYCLNYSLTNVAGLPPCVTGCANDAGILNQSDPSIDPFIPFLLCAQNADQCGSVCNIK
jgi:hypothetical protein